MRQDDAILVMLDIAGLGGFAGAQIPSVDSVRTVFQHRQSTLQLRTT